MFERRFRQSFALQGRKIIEMLGKYRVEEVISMVPTIIREDDIKKPFIKLYQTIGVQFARLSRGDLKMQMGYTEVKQDEQLEDKWLREMLNYANLKAGRRIVSITGSSKTIARRILSREFEAGIREGLGIEEITHNVTKKFRAEWGNFARYRSRRIVETEIIAASNKGAMEGARSIGIPMFKVWMAGGSNIRDYDNGSPFSHIAADGEQVAMNEKFVNSGEPMEMPGDPVGSPGNVINCKCCVAHLPMPTVT